MLQFTREQQDAIAKVLLDVASADGDLDFRETMYLMQLSDKVGFSIEDEEIRRYSKLNTVKCLETLKKMDTLKKKALLHMISEMTKVDGNVDSEEIKLLLIIAKFIE